MGNNKTTINNNSSLAIIIDYLQLRIPVNINSKVEVSQELVRSLQAAKMKIMTASVMIAWLRTNKVDHSLNTQIMHFNLHARFFYRLISATRAVRLQLDETV